MTGQNILLGVIAAILLVAWAIGMFHQLAYWFGVAQPAYRRWAEEQPFRVVEKRSKLMRYLAPPGHFGDIPIGGHDCTFRIVVQDAKGCFRKGWLRLCEHDQRSRCTVLVSWDDLLDKDLKEI